MHVKALAGQLAQTCILTQHQAVWLDRNRPQVISAPAASESNTRPPLTGTRVFEPLADDALSSPSMPKWLSPAQ